MNLLNEGGVGAVIGNLRRIISISKKLNHKAYESKMKYLFFLISLILINKVMLSQEIKVTFIVKSTALDDTSSVYITGNDEKLGDWDPSITKLSPFNKNSWKIDLSFPKGKRLEYKYSLGTWTKEALNDKGMIPENSTLEVIKDTTVSTDVIKWGTYAPKIKAIIGQITGTVKYHKNFSGKGLLSRDIIVWLPPSYEKDKRKRYPVLYAHDGQNLFDPSTSSFGVDWQLDETADSLIRQKKIEEIIIVGIYNTAERRKEYYTGETGERYLKFVAKRLKPFIDKTYRTRSSAKNTASIGSSAGGLVSFMLVWQYNDFFSGAACLSPAFNIRGIDYITPVLKSTGKKKDVKIYIDCGGNGLDSLLHKGALDMVSALKERGFEKGKDYQWFFDKDGEHNEPNWAKRVWRPLMFFYGRK
jgi:enterochelin esterase-like enzyme